MKLISVFSALIISGMFQYIAYAEELLSQQVEQQQQNNSVFESQELGKSTFDKKKKERFIIPAQETKINIRPQILTGVMYFKHTTIDPFNLSNKPVPFLGIGLNTGINNWFLNGYVLDSAKATDHIFLPQTSSGVRESNYNFYRRNYSISLGREITDWLTEEKNWGISLFVGYRQGITKINSAEIEFFVSPTAQVNFDQTKFDPKNPDTFPTATAKSGDYVGLKKTTYTIKGPLVGIALRKRLEGSNNEIGLTLGYGPLDGKYEREYAYSNNIIGSETESPAKARVNTFITAISWNGEITDKLSYSMIFDYYSYSMPFQQYSEITKKYFPITLKEAVGSAKFFLNYRF